MNNISNHAIDRVKQRSGGNPEKLLGDAMLNGNKPQQYVGSFRRYLDSLAIKHHSTPIIHKGKILFIRGSTLITLYDIPTKYKKYKAKEQL